MESLFFLSLFEIDTYRNDENMCYNFAKDNCEDQSILVFYILAVLTFFVMVQGLCTFKILYHRGRFKYYSLLAYYISTMTTLICTRFFSYYSFTTIFL